MRPYEASPIDARRRFRKVVNIVYYHDTTVGMTFSTYTDSLVQAGSARVARAKSSGMPARRLAQTCAVRHTPTHACARSLHERGVASSRARDRRLFDCPRSSLRNAKRAYKHQTGPLGERGELQGFEEGKRTALVGVVCLVVCVPALQ